MDLGNKKTNRKWIARFVAAALILGFTSFPCYAQFGGKFDSFTADNVEIDPNGKVINSAKLYVTKDAIRIDGLPGAGMGDGPKMDLTMLILKKQKKTLFYNHDKKLVFETPADEKDFETGYKALGNIESEKVLGKEKVSGYLCLKKEIVTRMEAMGQTMKNKLIVWESDKFEMPVRTMDEGGATQEMRNIKTGSLAKKLFRPMAGYKRVDNMMAVMGMDFNAMRDQKNSAQDNTKNQKETNESLSNETIDAQALMAHLQESMGQNMNPEEKAQMMQIMGQAMAQVSQTHVGQGASKDLWKIIPKREGDKVGYEMKINNILDVILGTSSTLQQVFDFYEKKLSAKGWKNPNPYSEKGQMTMSMHKGDETIMFAWADRPVDLTGNFNIYYNVHYTRY